MAGYRLVSAVTYEKHPHLTPAQVKKCRLPEGFTFISTDDSQIVEPALLYLFDKFASTQKRWHKRIKSQRAECEDLYEWWSYLEAANIHWDDVESDDVKQYRTALQNSISPRTLRPYASATIRRRIGTILRFYDWAHGQKYIEAAVDRTAVKQDAGSADSDPMAHLSKTDGTREVSDILPEDEEHEPNPFHNADNLHAVLRRLGPLPSERNRADLDFKSADGRPSRDRLVAAFSLATAARLSEVLGVTLADILSLKRPASEDPTTPILLWLTVTKRYRPRQIVLPLWLYDELMLYIDGERKEAVEKAASLGRRPSAKLFVNGTSANHRDVGNSLTPRAMSRAFREAVIGAGLHSLIEAPAEHGAGRRIVLQHTFHDLRHTWAVQQYLARKAAGEAEPWKPMSGLMGHKSWKTTMDLYVRSVSIAESLISDAVSSYFRSIMSLGRV